MFNPSIIFRNGSGIFGGARLYAKLIEYFFSTRRKIHYIMRDKFTAADSYLVFKETGAARDVNAWKRISKIRETDPEIWPEEKKHLEALKIRFSYVEIESALNWIRDFGVPRSGSRPRRALRWLAARPGRVEAALAAAGREEIRAARRERFRAMISEMNAESERAERVETAALAEFCREYPSDAERRRALIRIYNLHRDQFGPVSLSDPAGHALAVAIAVEELRAIARIVQDAPNEERRGVGPTWLRKLA